MTATQPVKARLLTIGTEITCGEIVNSNAAWISVRLEELGVRVYSHLTVRDLKPEMQAALKECEDAGILIVTGGLGPTSDDLTREVMAEWAGRKHEFDEKVWSDLQALYQQRGLKILEAHRHQCHFPTGSERLINRAGTALGFAFENNGQKVFVLPGPPHELQKMWTDEVEPRLKPFLPKTSFRWERWTVLGTPESEVAEGVEKVIQGSGVEVGYRATYPYVKTKAYLDLNNPAHQKLRDGISQALSKSLVGRGHEDLAEEFIRLWPGGTLKVRDSVSGLFLSERLNAAAKGRDLRLEIALGAPMDKPDVELLPDGEGFSMVLGENRESKVLPYQVKLSMDRGKKAAAEWALWFWVRNLRAASAKP